MSNGDLPIIDDISSVCDENKKETIIDNCSRASSIQLDPDIIHQFRLTINEDIDRAIKKHHTIKKKNTVIPSWNQICATMDRIEDTVQYLNQMELNTGRYKRSAFDFFEFMSESFVLTNCIELLAHTYDYELTGEDSRTDVFNQLGINGKGTDKRYFEYIRSLCSAHPDHTAGFIDVYQSQGGESCPFVLWNDHTLDDEGDLIARVYCNDESLSTKVIPINLNQVFRYVEARYNLIPAIQQKVLEYNESEKEKYRHTQLKDESCFDSYFEYLDYLGSEEAIRSAGTGYNELNHVKIVLRSSFFDNLNKEKHEKYCNALKYAVSFEHLRIQTLSDIDSINGTLLQQLVNVDSGSDERKKQMYAISKLDHLLNPDDDHYDFVKQLIFDGKSFFGKRIHLDESINGKELYVLVHVGMYCDCLQNDCFINDNIPNDNKYR